MGTITKKDLIDRITDRTTIKRPTVKTVVQEFLDQVITELKKGNRLEFRDFGVFEVKQRAARSAQNPKTLERVDVPAKRTVKFKVGRLMRESLEDPATRGGKSAQVVVPAKTRLAATKVEA
jgi:integration host factor subunit beta